MLIEEEGVDSPSCEEGESQCESGRSPQIMIGGQAVRPLALNEETVGSNPTLSATWKIGRAAYCVRLLIEWV